MKPDHKPERSSHVDPEGRPAMVDISGKQPTQREAVARGVVEVPPSVAELFRDGEMSTSKGPVIHTAIIAGTQAVKKTAELIPFCHPLAVETCRFEVTLEDGNIVIQCRVGAFNKTGVEMEALTGVTAAALTVYDMCKSVSQDLYIKDIRLIRKTGGKSDLHRE